ncbi:hypothetical protein H105_06390 [Trichophyton soudanense CBS 452.61]|uniref:Uncharacterized protein n=1 Tax=Trichophyton soudanense CBS 452.61 TaxID=1215331 RepID=A0A022XKZ1_TRISD|nr:hypothetical protein H105_06390 [Trichophyton soudanense CBS 452.61]EZG03997.1 hypothetical protein H106_06218 [Trichophyton rubrum CBS 735.88]
MKMGSITKSGDAPPTRLLRSNAPPSPPQVLSAQKLFTTIRNEILQARGYKDLVFENVPPEAGSLVIDSLDEDPDVENSCARLSYNSFTLTISITIMPTFLYEAHTAWLYREVSRMARSGFLTPSEEDSISFLKSPTFGGLQPPYSASRKEPDFALLPDGQSLPILVFETGWSESAPRLHHDKDLWLRGGRPEVQLVFLVKWSKSAGGVVRGIIEVHGRNGVGEPQLLQTETIFPAPPNPEAQTIPITRGQLMGPNLLAGRNPGDVHQLSVDLFRRAAGKLVLREGYTPA